jgi:hypothetical protein
MRSQGEAAMEPGNGIAAAETRHVYSRHSRRAPLTSVIYFQHTHNTQVKIKTEAVEYFMINCLCGLVD